MRNKVFAYILTIVVSASAIGGVFAATAVTEEKKGCHYR